MQNKEIVFKNYLNSKGLKFTPERSLILDAVFSMNGHFDVEKVYDRLHKKNKTISAATIYRSLPHLIDAGLIREVLRCKNRPQYEVNLGRAHHDHLLCLKCGRVLEFRDDDIEKLQDKVCRKFHFEPVEHRLGIRGYCRDCFKKSKSGNS
jgi:Fur family transcriptional regulator, ferric uptake regulator